MHEDEALRVLVVHAAKSHLKGKFFWLILCQEIKLLLCEWIINPDFTLNKFTDKSLIKLAGTQQFEENSKKINFLTLCSRFFFFF